MEISYAKESSRITVFKIVYFIDNKNLKWCYATQILITLPIPIDNCTLQLSNVQTTNKTQNRIYTMHFVFIK
jgi:hypothetical protein